MVTRLNGSDIIRIALNGHNTFTGLQGGAPGEYYHVTEDTYNTLTSGIHGDIFFNNGTELVRLVASTSGYILETRNSGYDPIWVDRAINHDHESLTGILGSTSGMHYHLTSGDNTLLTSGINGDVIYHDGSRFTRLSPSTSGYLLETRNSGAAPIWVERAVNHDHELLTNVLGSTSGMHYHLTSSDNTLLTSGIYGDVIYHDGTNFTRLSPGASGYILETRNSGAAPIWVERAVNHDHESLTGLLGGSSGMHYHVTSSDYVGTGSGTLVRASLSTLTSSTLTSPTITSPIIIGTAILSSGSTLNVSSGTLTLGDNVVSIPNGGTGLTSAPIQPIFLSLAGGWSSMVGGDDGFTTVGTTSGVTYRGTKFVTTISSYSYHEFAAPMPDNWNLGSMTARPYFLTSGATSNQTIVLGLQGVSLGDGDAIESAYGVAGEVTITTSSNIAGKLIKGNVTPAITIGGTPSKGDWTQFRTYRGGDTFSGDVVVLGWYVNYTTSGYTVV